ncbi:MAG: serine/threonine-protein kinase [Myxococcota bacterium]
MGGRFELERKLGAGSFGDVWQAKDLSRGGQVAVKLLKARWAANPRVMQRFETEIEVLRVLDHPNIAGAVAASIALPAPYLALEFIAGETLFDRLVALGAIGRSLEAEEAAAILSAVAAGVEHAHGHGILHRDLKPSNIMIPADPAGPRARILDFGIAKILEVPEDLQTTVGRVIGTDNYLAPEQLRGGEIGPTADVFSLGCVAFSMLTARYAFAHDVFGQPRLFGSRRPSSDTPLEVARRIANEPRPNASAFRAELGAEVDFVLRKAMAATAEERYPSAKSFADALSEALSRPRSERAPSTTFGMDPGQTQDAPAAPPPQLTRVMPSDLDPPQLEPASNPQPTPSAPLVIGVVDPTPPPRAPAPQRSERWPLAAGAAGVAMLLALGALSLSLRTMAPPQEALPVVSPAPAALKPAPIGAHPLESVKGSTAAAALVETPAAPAPTPKRAFAAATPRPTAAERPEKAAASDAPLEAALRAARSDPSNVGLLERLARAIEEAAGRRSPEEAAIIKRCLASAQFDLDLGALERCAARLR